MDNLNSEEKFLEGYNSKNFDRPNTTVDTVIFTIIEKSLNVLLIKRSDHPFKDKWSLIGGFIDINKDTELKSTAKRKLKEKTDINAPYLEQYKTIGNGNRDPRGWATTTVYFALIPPNKIKLNTGLGATDIKFVNIDDPLTKSLAFDHTEILEGCINRLRKKVLYTSLPIYFMPSKFTIRELQNVYEIILDQELQHKSFRRRILGADILLETGEMRKEPGRPAVLYKLNNNLNTHYFFRNIEGSR